MPEYTKNSFKVEPDKPCFVYLKSRVAMLVGKHPEISVCFERGTLRQCFFKATELAYTNCEDAAENAGYAR